MEPVPEPTQRAEPLRSPARVRGEQLFRMALPFYGVLAALAAAWRWWGRDAWLFAPADGGAWGALDASALGAGAGLAIVAGTRIWTRVWPVGEAVARMLGETLGELRLRECVVLAVSSGFAEEMVFRGALQPEVGLLAASVLFGLAHVVPRWPLFAWSLFAVVVGVVLGLLLEWTGSLWAPAVAHTVVNGVNLPLLSREYGRGAG